MASVTPHPPDPARAPHCPLCGAANPLPVAYGLPSSELMERAEQGEVALGGCVIGDDPARYRCRACGHAWA